MTLDATGDEPIELYLDSPDGTLEATFVLIDTLDLLRAPVHAHCRGQAGGPALGVVAVADHRSAAPHARFRLSQPTAQFPGPSDQLVLHSQQYQESLRRFEVRLAKATGRPADEIARDLRRGRYFDAREALEYGLIDEISVPAP